MSTEPETTRYFWCRVGMHNVPADEAETHECEGRQPISSPPVRNHRKRAKKTRKQPWRFQGNAGRPSMSERWPGA